MDPRAKGADEVLERLEAFGVRLGLETTARQLERLGRPQDRFACVLVAGTNGKGSTSALLASILSAAGYRSGLYTSPHLERVEERVRIDGRSVEGRDLAESLTRIVGQAEADGGPLPTYFEALTLSALDLFAAGRVEVAVLEVGMGGRLDATNVVDPVVSLVSEISIDHGEHLGPTPAAIAREKGGIFRAGRPAVAAPGRGAGARQATEALIALAAEKGTPLEILTDTTSLWAGGVRGPARRVRLSTPEGEYRLTPSLAGEHQLANLALAVRGAELVAASGFAAVDAAAIETGVARCRWPGRLELVATAGRRPVLLDAAHNASGVESLLAHLEKRGEPFDLLFGALRDKEVGEMLPRLAERAGQVHLTQPRSGRACAVEELVPLAAGRPTSASAEPAAALAGALSDPGAPLLVVCGSLYLVGEVRERLREVAGAPPPAVDPLW